MCLVCLRRQETMINAHSKPSMNALIVQRLHLNHVRFWFKAKTGAVDSLQPQASVSFLPKSSDVKCLFKFTKSVWSPGNSFELSIQTRFLIIKLLSDCPVFILSSIHGIFFFVCGSTVNLRHKSNKISRYFHGLFYTLVIFVLHELVNEH